MRPSRQYPYPLGQLTMLGPLWNLPKLSQLSRANSSLIASEAQYELQGPVIQDYPTGVRDFPVRGCLEAAIPMAAPWYTCKGLG